MSDMRKLPALQGFKIDEVSSQQGPVVALTLALPPQRPGAKLPYIDVGLSLDQAEALGRKLVELTEKLRSKTH